MRRFDYRLSRARRLTGFELPSALPRRFRRPLTGLAGSVALACIAGIVQSIRLQVADGQAADYALRVAAAERSIAHVRTLAGEVERIRALVARVDDIRRSGPARASELAALGNNLPDDAWFTAIHVERNAVTLEGRGTRLASVGATLGNLALLPAYAGARLVSVRDDPSRRGVTYAISLEPIR
jgi:Tfp pilus assembly protein PilN